MLYELQKQSVHAAISLNPTIVTVYRDLYTEDAGGRKKTSSTVGTYTILLFSRMLGRNKVADTAGNKDVVLWYALFDETAQIMWGANVKDYFVVADLGKFTIETGYPVTSEGQTAGYHVTLEMEK